MSMFKKLKTKIKQLAQDQEGSPGRRGNADSNDEMDPQMLEYVQRLAADPSIPRSTLDDQLVKRHLDY